MKATLKRSGVHHRLLGVFLTVYVSVTVIYLICLFLLFPNECQSIFLHSMTVPVIFNIQF